jgi:hypothetical protein
MHLVNLCKRLVILIFYWRYISNYKSHTQTYLKVHQMLTEVNEVRFWYIELCLGAVSQINLFLFSTYSTNRFAALTYFRHVGVLTNFHTGSFISILYTHSLCVWRQFIALWGSESGSRLGSRHPSRVSRAMNAIAAKILEIWWSECRHEILIPL